MPFEDDAEEFANRLDDLPSILELREGQVGSIDIHSRKVMQETTHLDVGLPVPSPSIPWIKLRGEGEETPPCPSVIHVRLQMTGCFFSDLELCQVNFNIDVEGDVVLIDRDGSITWNSTSTPPLLIPTCTSLIGETYEPNPDAFITINIHCGAGAGITSTVRVTDSLGCINGTPVPGECPFNQINVDLNTGGFPEGTGTTISTSGFGLCTRTVTTTLSLPP